MISEVKHIDGKCYVDIDMLIEVQNDLDASNSRTKELGDRIIKAINSIDILQEIICQQSKNKEDDMWLQERLSSIKIVLKGEPNNE